MASPTADTNEGLCCVVFGAAVRPGGVPSGTLRRRVDGAFAHGGVTARYFVTGALGAYPPTEAEVMAELLLAHGVTRDRIVLDPRGTDTLSSAVNCAQLITEAGNCARIAVCSSRYHMPRCRMLLRVFGVPAVSIAMPADLPHLSRRKLAWFYLREMIAYPYDFVLAMVLRRSQRRQVAPGTD
jgi:uncharacterized SAM-binding protein YcdF (DUF218 family)